MPRGPRLDAPGVLQHVMARGIERQVIFRDDHDRANFVYRLEALVQAGALSVYAWALLPNHFHLLVRTAHRPLARSMRSLLTGYAGTYNRRHCRSGHLFQNRYKSIVCEEELYFLELVRYLHLNPLRAGVVKDLKGLARYPYCGRTVLLGEREYAWQETDAVLGRFATDRRRARHRYATFVAEGVQQGRRPDLQGGGLVRSAGGWEAVQELRRGREQYTADERILGGSEFVEQIRKEVEGEEDRKARVRRVEITLEEVVEKVCQAEGVRPQAVAGGGRRPVLCRVREGVAYLWIEWLGRSGPLIARVLGVQPEAVYRIAQRGQQDAEQWQRILER
jgi:REP-associated tyrosine transposase